MSDEAIKALKQEYVDLKAKIIGLNIAMCPSNWKDLNEYERDLLSLHLVSMQTLMLVTKLRRDYYLDGVERENVK